MPHGGEVRGDDVGDISEVAGLPPVAEDDRPLARAIRVTNSEITPLYGLDGSCRGPKMLK